MYYVSFHTDSRNRLSVEASRAEASFSRGRGLAGVLQDRADTAAASSSVTSGQSAAISRSRKMAAEESRLKQRSHKNSIFKEGN